jgi:hypothetical protein
MNFHAKTLLAFLAFHFFVTGDDALMFDQLPQALGQGANDNNAQLLGAVVPDAVDGRARHAYLSRAAWKMGSGSWWRYGSLLR